MNCAPFAVQAVWDTHSKLTLAISLYVYKPSLLVSALFFLSFPLGLFILSLHVGCGFPQAGWRLLSRSRLGATEYGMLASRKLGGNWPGDLERGNIKSCSVCFSQGSRLSSRRRYSSVVDLGEKPGLKPF